MAQGTNFYILGSFDDTVRFANGKQLTRSIMATDSSRHFLARINGVTGAADWLVRLGGSALVEASALSVNANGLYTVVDSATQSVVCRFDLATGARTNLIVQGGSSTTSSIWADGTTGAIYVAGGCAAPIMNFGGTSFAAPPAPYINYLVRYRADGTHDWHHWQSDITCFGRTVLSAGPNRIYYVGPLGDSSTFGTHFFSNPAPGTGDFMLAQLDSNGAVNWGRQLLPGSAGISLGANGAAILPSIMGGTPSFWGEIFLCSRAAGVQRWSASDSSFSTTPSATVVSYSRDGAVRDVKMVSADRSAGTAIAIGSQPQNFQPIYVTGAVADSVNIGFGAVSVPTPSAADRSFIGTITIVYESVPELTGDNHLGVIVPNPAHTFIRFAGLSDGGNGAVLTLFNSVGHAVLAHRFSEENDMLDVSHLPRGLYFYSITGREEVSRKGTIILR